MYRTQHSENQTIVYLVAGFAMLAASFNILTNEYESISTPLLIIIGIFIAYQEAAGLQIKQLIRSIINTKDQKVEQINHEPSKQLLAITHEEEKPDEQLATICHDPDELPNKQDKAVELTYFELTWRKLVEDLLPPTISSSMAMNPVDAKFSAQVELIMYDIIVEATKNIVQHAEAKMAEVKIDVLEKTTLLFIQDDGVGFTVRKVMPKATGLQRIKKQVEALSGTVMFDSAKGKGTAILIEFPNQQGFPVLIKPCHSCA